MVTSLKYGTMITLQEPSDPDRTTTLWKSVQAVTVRICNGVAPVPNGGKSGDSMEDIGSIDITIRFLLSQKAKIEKDNKYGPIKRPLLGCNIRAGEFHIPIEVPVAEKEEYQVERKDI